MATNTLFQEMVTKFSLVGFGFLCVCCCFCVLFFFKEISSKERSL